MMPVKCWSSLSCVSRFSRSINLHLSCPPAPLTSTPTSAARMMRFMVCPLYPRRVWSPATGRAPSLHGRTDGRARGFP